MEKICCWTIMYQYISMINSIVCFSSQHHNFPREFIDASAGMFRHPLRMNKLCKVELENAYREVILLLASKGAHWYCHGIVFISLLLDTGYWRSEMIRGRREYSSMKQHKYRFKSRFTAEEHQDKVINNKFIRFFPSFDCEWRDKHHFKVIPFRLLQFKLEAYLNIGKNWIDNKSWLSEKYKSTLSGSKI